MTTYVIAAVLIGNAVLQRNAFWYVATAMAGGYWLCWLSLGA